MKKIILILALSLIVLVVGTEFGSGIYLENKFSKKLQQANNFYYTPKVEVSGSPLVNSLRTRKIPKLHFLVFPSDILPGYRATIEATLIGVADYSKLLDLHNPEGSQVKRIISRTSINSNTLGKFLHITDLKAMVASRPGNTLGGPGDFSLQTQKNIILSGTVKLSNQQSYKLSVLASCSLQNNQVFIQATRLYTGPDFHERLNKPLNPALTQEALAKFSGVTPPLWIPFETNIAYAFFMGTDLVLYGEKLYSAVRLRQFRPAQYSV